MSTFDELIVWALPFAQRSCVVVGAKQVQTSCTTQLDAAYLLYSLSYIYVRCTNSIAHHYTHVCFTLFECSCTKPLVFQTSRSRQLLATAGSEARRLRGPERSASDYPDCELAKPQVVFQQQAVQPTCEKGRRGDAARISLFPVIRFFYENTNPHSKGRLWHVGFCAGSVRPLALAPLSVASQC